jgi:hypothetical protein
MTEISNDTKAWLQEVLAKSSESAYAATELLNAINNPDTPTPPNPSESEMDLPTNESELRDALTTYAHENRVGQIDSRMYVEVERTIEIGQAVNAGSPWGFNANYGRIKYVGGRGDDLLRFVGVNGVSNRGLTIKNVSLDGNDPNMNGDKAATCLKLSAPLGDSGPLYKFNIENVFTMQAANGIILEGGVYEGMMMNTHAENCSGDGILMRHLNLGQPGQGVVSNILMVHPNSSRNLGAGILTVYSVYILGGSFILNGNGGVRAPDGLRGMTMSNGENTAGREGAAFVIPSNGYGSVVTNCEGSSDGSTVCRKWDGTKWVDIGSPMLYLLDIDQAVAQSDNHVSYYGGSPSNPMRVVK